MASGMTHEPDVLEACDMLQVQVTVPAVLQQVRATVPVRLSARHIVVGCRFAHDKIFDHYRQLNRNFWLHERA